MHGYSGYSVSETIYDEANDYFDLLQRIKDEAAAALHEEFMIQLGHPPEWIRVYKMLRAARREESLGVHRRNV